MTGRALADNIFREPMWLAFAVLFLAGAAILGALGFEHLGGYQPCALCLMQRTPYYLGIPLAMLAALAVWMRAPRAVGVALFGAIAALFIYNAALATYHAGVEWRFWEGPASCAPSVGVGDAADMLNQLQNMQAPSCTDATWRFAGLSFAGWNILISAVIAALATCGAWASRRQEVYGSSTASQYR